MKTLKDLFLDEVADIYDAEHRLLKALPKMAKAATGKKLPKALLAHLKQTEGHVLKLEYVFQCFDQPAKRTTCQATVGLLTEGDELALEYKGSPALNAALIAAAQKVEHHEIATYGCLREWADLLGNHEAAGRLQAILDEEKAANETLTELAKDAANNEALDQQVAKASIKVMGKSQAASRRAIQPAKATRKRARVSAM